MGPQWAHFYACMHRLASGFVIRLSIVVRRDKPSTLGPPPRASARVACRGRGSPRHNRGNVGYGRLPATPAHIDELLRHANQKALPRHVVRGNRPTLRRDQVATREPVTRPGGVLQLAVTNDPQETKGGVAGRGEAGLPVTDGADRDAEQIGGRLAI